MERERERVETSRYLPPLRNSFANIFDIYDQSSGIRDNSDRIADEGQREKERASERARGRFAKDNRVTVHFAAIT